MTVPVTDGTASLRFTSDNKGRRSGFVASYVALASAACVSDADCTTSAGGIACDEATGACVCAAGWAGLACDSPSCLAYNPWTISPGTIASNASSYTLPRNAHCAWAISATAAGSVAATGLRIIFTTFQIEADSSGDAVTITRTADGELLQKITSTAAHAAPMFSIEANFTVNCDGTSGTCSLEFPGETAMTITLTTDTNDGGATLRGVAATWYAVSMCPGIDRGALDCAANGGACSNGGCFLADGSATDCTCFKDKTCNEGEFWDGDLSSCAKCPAGTAEAVPGERYSCTKCQKGTFAPKEGSVSCGSCANGQVAPNRGSELCVQCPGGATCEDTSSVTINPGHWRPSINESSGGKFKVYACPIAEACPGGSGYGEALCSEGFVGPLCSHCGNHFFSSWYDGVCAAFRHCSSNLRMNP